MTNEDILAIAREVFDYEFKSDAQGQRLITFARRIQAAQKEKDAGICDGLSGRSYEFDMGRLYAGQAIREQNDE